ncbi:uncharacterized protein YuzB (UPF0349 family) [Anaerosolibacter carboniphilus]|uniref:Uncharacterized protein YuzB (UPF0349 family) n=1 Tax=Anaerosolibacter carboniphilus TaxID=1417629 RepID=A0A841KZW9_9FIRM|nr:DUF1450 domain-containing protein [Anaerosolibacter carboniphilus]MBB6219031.1 uncharacterized protein YuzB (UPF0349 family) [Anaerosolibacter carboniphilus]
MPEVHFCKNNLSKGVDKLIDRIENEYTDVSVRIESCIEFCNDCALRPIAITNGFILQDDTVEGLYNQIKEEL